ncbi:MAG: efflux RND transporter periplasmic adaptor subunit [Fusobacteriaceae bacterium]
MDKKKIAIVAIIVVAATAWVFKSKTESSKVLVRTAKVEIGNSSDKVTLEGIVVPESEMTVFAQVPVVIDKVEVKVGAKVTKGEVILSFTGEAKKEVEKALEEISIMVNTTEALLDTLKRQAKNSGFEAEVTKQQAEVNKQLLDQDAISSVEVSRSVSIANKAASEHEDFKSRYLVETQKYNLLKVKKSQLQQKFKFIQSDLRAEADGIITELVVENGSILREGQKILSIAKEGNYKIKIEAPANLISSIKEMSDASVKDLSNNNASQYAGTVTKVSRVARNDAKNQRVIDVEIELKDGTGLNPGFLTAVEISGAIGNSTAKLVDSFSVLEEEGKNYVYMVKEGTVTKIPVEVGIKTNTKYEIIDLPVGAEIIVNPNRVKPGQMVRVGK